MSLNWQAAAGAGLCVEEELSQPLACTRVPAVAVPYTLKIRSGCEGGGKGALVQEDKSATLATNNDQYLFQPVGVDLYNQALSGDVAICLRSSAEKGADNTPCVAYGLDRASFNQGQNAKFDFTVSEEQQPTLTARGPGAVVHASKASFFTRGAEGAADTLVATDYKDPQIIAYEIEHPHYIVRRLTPTECARLQGFADWWGWLEEKKTLTEEEYKFWMEVRNTHARINGKPEKDYTEKQMLTWYNKLWTDSAEYKMWGNGIALPTALYCIQGMAEVLARAIDTAEDDDDWML